MSLFCSHDYNVISEVTTKSPLEIASNNGLSVKKAGAWIFEREHITTLKCSKCDKIKRHIVSL